MNMVSVYRSSVNDHLMGTCRFTDQFPTTIPNVSAQNRKTVFRRPDHVIFAVPDRVLPRLYPSIHSVYAAICRRPKPPKGVGFTDPLSGTCLLYTSPSPRDRQKSRMPSSA